MQGLTDKVFIVTDVVQVYGLIDEEQHHGLVLRHRRRRGDGGRRRHLPFLRSGDDDVAGMRNEAPCERAILFRRMWAQHRTAPTELRSTLRE